MLSSSPPFFIIGVHRSGTTLLRFMLCRHSRMYIPPESDFIPYFFRKEPTAQLSDQRITRLLEIIFNNYRFVEEWQGTALDPATLISLMPDRTPASFLNVLYSSYARQNGKVRWGDKTPIYASYVDLIHKIFPTAKFIHIVRDSRDACISLLEKYQEREFHIDVFFAAQNWVRRISDIYSSLNRMSPELFYELRYEDLVNNPETKLGEVCAFLGERYEPSMLEQHLLAQEIIPPDSHFFSNVRKPVNSESIGRGIKKLSAIDKRLIQLITGPLMVKFGYELEELGEMTTSERIRFTLLRIKYITLQTGRKFMTSLNLMPPI